MKLAGDACAFFFPRGLKVRRKRAQLFSGGLELRFRVLEFRHILGSAKYLNRLSPFIAHNGPSRTSNPFGAVGSKDAMIIIIRLFTRDRAFDGIPTQI